MPTLRSLLSLFGAALLLSACSYANSMLGSSSSPSTSTDTNGTTIPIQPSAAEANPQPMLSAAPLASANPPSSAGTGTFVGQKVANLRIDLQRLQGNLANHQQQLQQARQAQESDANTYFSLIAAINSRLQVGTTPGNPQLLAQWNQAQTTLDRMSDDVARLNSIANDTASDSSFASYILNEVRAAYSLQGAVDEDHRQLRQIETDTSATVPRIDQLLNTLSDDVARQSGYVTNERNNLVTLSLAIQNGQLYGPSLANRNFNSAAIAPTIAAAPRTPVRTSPVPPAPQRSGSAAPSAGDRPLVVIRFDRPDVSFDQALYTAVSRALERKPDATFDVVAVAPNAGTPAQVAVNSNTSKQNAQNVMRALTNMGLPADRVSLSATMSPEIQSNEVRLFVR